MSQTLLEAARAVEVFLQGTIFEDAPEVEALYAAIAREERADEAANRRLIAAAPELLAVAEAIIAGDMEENSLREFAARAIARAEGKTV